ncbi:MAG TPA: glucose-6-phosphate isomerase, partial [Curvibacter sp.]|nr:glucose-6-phosphate isomerase [Curvibacter sp.]
MRLRCDSTPAWGQLRECFEGRGRYFDLRAAFAADPGRYQALSLQAPHVFADLSKNLIDAPLQATLTGLAQQCNVVAHREAMFGGEHINQTEDRAVMHWLLRHPGEDLPVAVQAEFTQVRQVLDAMLAYAQAVREDAAITDIVNIGIGGSDLGPQMAVLALDEFVDQGKRYHFVSSVDGHELSAVLRQVRPESTLFLVASKSFTTLETMTNARSARAWFTAQGGRDIARHFCALTSNVQAAAEFGISTTFGFWDWVGGRYSVCSAVGMLPLSLQYGFDVMEDFLRGANDIDEHFRSAPPEENIPITLGMCAVWNVSFLGYSSRAILPYCQALAKLPSHIQQVSMESNGKGVGLDGRPLPFYAGE